MVVVVVVEEASSLLLLLLLQRALVVVVVAETKARDAARVGEKDHETEESVANNTNIVARSPSFMRDNNNNNNQGDLSVVVVRLWCLR